MPYWPPFRGLGANQLERLTLTGITSTYSDRGMFYGKVTATDVELYRDVARGASDKVATGPHLSASTWTKVTLSAANNSNLSGSIWVKYDSEDDNWEVYPTLATDTELQTLVVNLSLYPKTGGDSTFERQHKKTREDFVRRMLQLFPPALRRGTVGTTRGSESGPWRVNSVGDFELVALQNVADWRNWAEWHTIAMLARTINKVLTGEMQLRMIEDADAQAEKAWAEVVPLLDQDNDLDADVPRKRNRISRG